MSETLFTKIVDIENMEKAYKKSLKGGEKYNKEAMIFSLNSTYNLYRLRQSLIDGTYEFEGYIHFKVYEPKERIVDAPHYRDKIVQLSINNILKEIYNPCFIYDSYACIDNKGTHKAVERISYFMRKAAWEYGDKAFIIKIDIKKFFYSIDREILKKILTKKIKCKKTLNLLFKIIDSADVIDPLGLPLGNTLSQICANIYMNELDQYCKRKLGLHYYVRYADDVVVIVKNKDEAQRVLGLAKDFLKEELHLNTNTKKTKIFPIDQGVNTVGFKTYKSHRLLRNDSKKKIKRKAKKMRRLILEDKMTVEKAEQILNSWLGHARNGCSYNFINKLLEKNDYICLDHKGTFKVDILKLQKEGDLDAV
ncbi:MAG: RNA-dependent DNA polymerase [Clostridiaceae bacterium]|nr:RNA-dependent DNA polymerase [Clostridiaceae bacterium]